jgi:hypothetical protein
MKTGSTHTGPQGTDLEPRLAASWGRGARRARPRAPSAPGGFIYFFFSSLIIYFISAPGPASRCDCSAGSRSRQTVSPLPFACTKLRYFETKNSESIFRTSPNEVNRAKHDSVRPTSELTYIFISSLCCHSPAQQGIQRL